jgi:hypothetical protein
MTDETTEEIVRETLGKSYDQYGFQGNQRLINDFVYTLADPSMSVIGHDGEASPAAQNIRSSLWSCFTGGGEEFYALASKATTELFTVLGRENELGRIGSQQ